MRCYLWALICLLACSFLAGCETGPRLWADQDVDRADFAETALPQTPPAPPTASTPDLPTTLLPEPITGTYIFAIPATVTRLKRETNEFEQYSLYEGRPAPEDLPFLVITVGKGFAPTAKDANSGFQLGQSRTYMLHGLLVQEWTGFTKDGFPFNEMIVTHDPKQGSQLHAVAIARNDAQRKLALETLSSIKWQQTPAQP